MASIILRDPDRDFYKRKRVVQASGSTTENYSEVLSQICLGFDLAHGRTIHWSDLVQIGSDGYPALTARGLPILKKDWLDSTIKSKLKLPTGSALGRTGMSPYSRTLISWSLQKLGSMTWLSAVARNMGKLKSNLGLGSKYVVWNDKAIEGKRFSPYRAYKNTGTKVDANKWNPADMWIMNDEGQKVLSDIVKAKWGLPQFNTALVNAYKDRQIIPVSLKKPQAGGYHQAIMNTDEYYHRIVIGETPDPTFEFTDGNKDIKINFTIQTVELPSGWTADRADKSPFGIPNSAKVITSQNVRLKYKTSGNQLELEFTSTSGGSLSAALGGKMGTGNIRKIIEGTSQQGVQKVKDIQREYKTKQYQKTDKNGTPMTRNNGDPIMENFDVGRPDWYSTNQMGGSDPRKIRQLDSKNKDQHDLFCDYVYALWEEIGKNSSSSKVPNIATLKDKFGKPRSATGLTDVQDFWSKSRAGEMGLAVSGVNSSMNRRRLIQNLYDVAGSVAYRTGLTKTEQIIARQTGDLTRFKINTSRKTVFKSGPYVKVY
tara:strand:- start:236 stop:1861 length:1626 start_codon:yes stop_codon:yes gene_type:complete